MRNTAKRRQVAFAWPLTAPRDVRNTIVYVLMNQAKHGAKRRAKQDRQHVDARHGLERRHDDWRRESEEPQEMGNWKPYVPFSQHGFAVDPCSSAPYFNSFAREPGDEER